MKMILRPSFLLALATCRVPREYLVVLGLYAGVFSLIYGLTHVGQPRYRGEVEFMFLPAVGAGAAWILARTKPTIHATLIRVAPLP